MTVSTTTKKTKATTQAEVKSTFSFSVSSVQVFPMKAPMGKTKALVRVVLNESLQLTGIRIVDGVNGLFVAYPNDPGYKGDEYRSLFYPVTRDLRDNIESVVLAEYDAILKFEDVK